MANSIFTKIINKELEAEIIYEDNKCVAFMDKFPLQPGHFLIVPRKESKNIIEMEQELVAHCMSVARKLAKKRILDKGIPGFKILINTGSTADQTIFHTHFHVIPYKEQCKDN